MGKLLVSVLLALTATNTMAVNMVIYKDKEGQALLTAVNPSQNLTPNLIVTEFDKDNKVTKIKRYHVRQVRKATAQLDDYSPEAYESKFTLINEEIHTGSKVIHKPDRPNRQAKKATPQQSGYNPEVYKSKATSTDEKIYSGRNFFYKPDRQVRIVTNRSGSYNIEDHNAKVYSSDALSKLIQDAQTGE